MAIDFTVSNTTADIEIPNNAEDFSVQSAGTDTIAWGNITGTLADQTDLTNALATKANTTDLALVALTGSYDDLIGTPTIPTKTSQLTNDSGFLTQHQSLADYSTTVQMNSAISAHHDSTKYDASNPSHFISQAVDDNSTTSTTLGWSANKLNSTIGNIEALLEALR